jgi:hypothetical protein
VPSRSVRLAAAAALVAAAGAGGVVGVGASPAQAAPCTGSTGVTVVVDPGALGGAVRQDCVSSSGRAAALFEAAGDSLTYVTTQSGFVCRVNGAPASDPCDRTPPATAYWGLFWSDGKSGTWSYASSGVSGQIVPDGGYVAFAWQSGSGQDQPDVPATARSGASTPAPSPTAAPSTSSPSERPSTRPTKKPTQRPGGSSPTQSTARPTPSVAPTTSTETPAPTSSASPDQTTAPASPSGTPAPTTPATESSSAAAATPGATGSTAPTSAPTSPDVVSGPVEPASAGQSGTLPAWVVPLVLVLIAGGGVATYVVRRRARPSP